MYPIRVAIVAAAPPNVGEMRAAGYESFARTIEDVLSHETIEGDGEPFPRFAVRVVSTAIEALEGCLSTPGSNRILVFLSVSFLEEAKQIARDHYGAIKVRVLVGALRSDEPVIIHKSWLNQGIPLASLIE